MRALYLAQAQVLAGSADREDRALAAKVAAFVATMPQPDSQRLALALAIVLAPGPPLVLLDEPTRGIDIGTKAEVHRLLAELVASGVAVLMISSELPEVLGVADRVLVLREGRLMAEFSRGEATESAIMKAATGQISAAAR